MPSLSGKWSALVGALCLLPALGLTACVDRADTGVALQNVDADIVFGAPPKAAAPANTTSASSSRAEELDPFEDVAVNDKGFLQFLPPSFAPPPPPCPAASLTEFADVEAPLNVSTRPAVGVYRWKREGSQELTAAPGFKLPVTGFEKRLVSNVADDDPTDFRFDFAQTELNSTDVIVTTYRVRTAAPQQEAPSSDLRVGSPDRGIAVERIVRLDGRTGSQRAAALFDPAVLVLPLPIQPGEQVQSVGVDPASLATLRIEGKVTTRKQVDACGELVDGWAVEGTRTFSANGQTEQTKFTYVFATQLGGMPILEVLDVQTQDSRAQVTFTLGQVVPTAAPAEQK